MGVHDRAWSGIRILVFGESPTIPMQVEQGLAEATPGNELAVESFERYVDAYDFCKGERSVGLILLLENQKSRTCLDIFRNLAAFHEQARGPCFGVLLHEQKETVLGHSALRFAQGRLLDYLPVTDFIDPYLARAAMKSLWAKYMDATEQFVAPSAIQTAISEIIEQDIDVPSQFFLRRSAMTLISRLNISWWEGLAVRWYPFMTTLEKRDQTFWKTQKALRELVKLASLGPEGPTLEGLSDPSASLPRRMTAFLMMLQTARTATAVDTILSQIEQMARPGAAGLIRTIARARADFLALASDMERERNAQIAA